MNAVFYISAAVAVLSTLLALTRTNAVHGLLYLIVSLLSVASIFLLFGAPFVAALEVIIYAGAIMVLFVFVIMILNIVPQAMKREGEWLRPETWAGPAALAAVLLGELVYIISGNGGALAGGRVLEPREVGAVLLGQYILGVELSSILLLAGLVGAYHLGRHEQNDQGDGS